MPDAVFVYGTLMPGRLRWTLLAPFAVDRVEASAQGRLWDTGLGWPAAEFPSPDDDPRVGAIPGWRVVWSPADGARVLATLDEIEGTPYRRVVVTTTEGEAWAYECRTVDPTWAPIGAWQDQPDR